MEAVIDKSSSDPVSMAIARANWPPDKDAKHLADVMRALVLEERERIASMIEGGVMLQSMIGFHGADYVLGWNAAREAFLDNIRSGR